MRWKKWTGFLLAGFLFVILLSYGLYLNQDLKYVEGVVAEVQTDGDAVSFMINNGKDVRILLTEDATLWPREDGVWTREQILDDIQPDAWADIWYYPHPVKLEAAQVRAYRAHSVSITGELKREALTLRDGTPVDIVEFYKWGGTRLYLLADGTKLLQVETSGKPEYAAASGESSALSVQAQEKIQAYYETQGLLFDEIEELENVYASYLELGEEFQCASLHQRSWSAGISERAAYFETSVSFPIEPGSNAFSSFSLYAAFDRKTGDQISPWDLFGVPEAEVRRRLPELTGWINDKALIEEMAEALDPAWIGISPQSVSVMFPPGSLPSSENGYLISVDLENIPKGFLQPWAVPFAN